MTKAICSKGTPGVEITLRCYCSCPWCYKKGLVHSKAGHVPVEIVRQRIDWLNDHVENDQIMPIGGEPLLHPDFRQICDYIVGLGKKVVLVTSAKVSQLPVERKNLDHALWLYAEGKLVDLNLSYQPGRNEKSYLSFLQSVKKRYVSHRKSRQASGDYDPKFHDLFSTIVVGRSYVGNREKFLELINFVRSHSGFSEYSLGETEFEETYQHLLAHFSDFGQSHSLGTTMYWEKESSEFRHSLRFQGETEVEVSGNHHTVRVPQGGTCKAIKANIGDEQIEVGSLMVRTDGEVCFATSQCLPMVSGICNADIHRDHESVHRVASVSLKQIQGQVFLANRRKAAKNCNPDGSEKECTACPFDDLCSTCHSTVRNWK